MSFPLRPQGASISRFPIQATPTARLLLAAPLAQEPLSQEAPLCLPWLPGPGGLPYIYPSLFPTRLLEAPDVLSPTGTYPLAD